MRPSIFIFAALLAFLGGSLLASADTQAGSGWYVVQPVARPGTAQNHAPRYVLGTGVTAGMAGQQAVYVSNNAYAHAGAMRRDIPAEAWRGKRVRVSLRLKQEGDAHAWAGLEVVDNETNGITPANQTNTAGGNVWEAHQFIVDVPRNAVNLVLVAGFSGQGKVWVDGVILEAADSTIAANATRRIVNTAPPGCSPPQKFPCF
jgi:hypothetical protein